MMKTACGLTLNDSLNVLSILIKKKIQTYDTCSPAGQDYRYSIIVRNDEYYIDKLHECKTLFDFATKEAAEAFYEENKQLFEELKCLYE